MALEITCLNVSSTLPTIPSFNNMTSIPTHSYYNPNGKAIAQLISSSLARSTFSTDDVRLFLKLVTSDETKSWDVSAIVNIKPVTSAIIYSSLTLALFILLSLVFYIISCCNCRKRRSFEKYHQMPKRKCSRQNVCVVLILLIGLIVFAQMIYIAYQVRRATIFLDDSIKEINQEIYPKEVSLHLNHLLQQVELLDQYSTQADSIVIKASRSILVDAFDQILQEQYFLNTIRESAAQSEAHINELGEIIGSETSLLPVTDLLFDEIKNEHRKMIEQLRIPLQELCDYAGGSEAEIDNTIFDALYPIHEQMVKIIETIENDFLSYITPWQNAMLMNGNLENQIRYYVRLLGTILLVLIIIFGLVPIIFVIIIVICRRCRCQRKDSSSKHRNNNQENSRRKRFQSSVEDEQSVSSVHSSNGPSKVVLCWMRIIFIPMMIMLIMIVLLTGVLYTVDLFAQGACRTVHDDQPFLVSFLIDELLGPNSNNWIINGSDIQTTVTTMIDDCRNRVHFTEQFFENLLLRLQNDVNQAMNQLNKKIDDKFNASIAAIDITSDIDRLDAFSMVANSTSIQAKVQQISQDLKTLKMQFENITASTPAVPASLVNQTFDNLKSYVKIVLESTIDTCPLPLATIYKADTFICHHLATSINGLWFSLFIYMFFIIFGLCICGLFIYKRL